MRLGRIEVAALEYFRRTKVSADLTRSELRNGCVTLRDSQGNTLIEVIEGISAESITIRGAVNFASVPVFRIELRCWYCERRCLRSSETFTPGEIFECPRCGSGNVVPTDPMRASRE
ncbi:hypothetical protein ACG33_08780 [Steroidobacter denitrificans]|uniref:Uncharacterized protein n=1 Tax=Steroidobacter denitrificans TaxID=465721 RepID=A0A127F9U0_STEDE|nr:hypothetical protein [Steroidobacter denitrificans]AMN47186.1 hypothetical protein ACG33_08780 [Steroidobacter denitrificans]